MNDSQDADRNSRQIRCSKYPIEATGIAQLREQIEGSVIKSGTHKHPEDGLGKAL